MKKGFIILGCIYMEFQYGMTVTVHFDNKFSSNCQKFLTEIEPIAQRLGGVIVTKNDSKMLFSSLSKLDELNKKFRNKEKTLLVIEKNSEDFQYVKSTMERAFIQLQGGVAGFGDIKEIKFNVLRDIKRLKEIFTLDSLRSIPYFEESVSLLKKVSFNESEISND